jgi:uncharacterized membrane-anchored protein YhcB (DUF1043 family)
MDLAKALNSRISAYTSIIKHMPEGARDKRQHYHEKCNTYRRLLADLEKNDQTCSVGTSMKDTSEQ